MKKTCNGGHRTIKKGASTDPKKHFEVINFILGHFVNFLEEIYQENFFDVSSPLNHPYRPLNQKRILRRPNIRNYKESIICSETRKRKVHLQCSHMGVDKEGFVYGGPT